MDSTTPSRLSDRDLEAEVARLAGCEREATASLIAHLAELYSRRLHERAGYSSLFTYCTEALRLSEHEAYDRMKAAKVVRRYPAVLGLLASGRVNLTTIRLLAPHLTRTNHDDLFAAACGQRKRQVQELLARRFPKPDVASSVGKLPVRAAVPPASTRTPESISGPTTVDGVGPARVSTDDGSTVPSIPAPPRPLVRPLAPDRYQITFTATRETCEMLELAQDLLRHAIPSGDPAQIVGRALKVLVQELVKQRYAATDRPRASRGQAEDSRNIPAEVKRAVFVRDRGRCAFVGSHGRRCGERAFVDFHHLRPYAAGGPPTVDNIALRCRAHNRYEAEVFFGPAKSHDRADLVSEGGLAYGRLTGDSNSFRNENRGGRSFVQSRMEPTRK
jgi:hypothetical protein